MAKVNCGRGCSKPLRALVFSAISIACALPAVAANSLDASDGSPSNVVFVNDIGRVGINTTSPNHPVDVIADRFYIRNGTGYFGLIGTTGSLELASGRNPFSYIDFRGIDNTATDFQGRFMYFDESKAFTFISAGGGTKVGINTTSPQSTLAVKGKITAQEVEVTATGWADFVFDPDYRLMPLAEVKSFIAANGHLPDIPSAQEVEEKGINIGENQTKLLQKIEELTLYVISLNEQISEQKQQIEQLKGSGE